MTRTMLLLNMFVLGIIFIIISLCSLYSMTRNLVSLKTGAFFRTVIDKGTFYFDCLCKKKIKKNTLNYYRKSVGALISSNVIRYFGGILSLP
jgi:hypothetical protein